MGLLTNLGKRIVKGGLRTTGKGLTSLGNSKTALAGIGIGALALGAASKIGPAARDATLDFSMGDPNADAAFTGSKFSARYLAGTAIGGGLGGVIKASSPGDYFKENPLVPTSGAALGTLGIAGGAVGGVAGAAIGTSLVDLRKTLGPADGSLKSAKLMGREFTMGEKLVKKLQRPSKFGLATVGALGLGALGSAVGAGAATIGIGGLSAKSYINNNQQFFNESPYAPRSNSLTTASSLNASGDIVLGMHNSRRGY
jgi:hypothetical protein